MQQQDWDLVQRLPPSVRFFSRPKSAAGERVEPTLLAKQKSLHEKDGTFVSQGDEMSVVIQSEMHQSVSESGRLTGGVSQPK